MVSEQPELPGAAPAQAPGPEPAAPLAPPRPDPLPPFGPAFFLTQLRGFVRDRCPDAAMPRVEVHLHTGEVLDVCHVIGLTPFWVALAVYEDDAKGTRTMRTELVPYPSIIRVTVRGVRPAGGPAGFDPHHSLAVLPSSPPTPEEALLLVASGTPGAH